MEKIHKRLLGVLIVAGGTAFPFAVGAATLNLGVTADLAPTASTSSAELQMTETSQPSGPVMVTAADAEESGPILSSSTQVKTVDDFHAYARSAIQSNPNLEEVDASDGAVSVKYQEPGRVLGLFPVTMSSSATIDSGGNVTLTHPWYYFLTSTDTNNASLRAALSTEAAATFNQQASVASEGATSTTRATASLSASQAAQLLSGITLVLSSAFPATSSASATVSSAY